MSLIIKCRSCRRRIYDESGTCPLCKSSDGLQFIADYWPDGRHGKRAHHKINVDDVTVARRIADKMRMAALHGRKPEEAKKVDESFTIEGLTDDYLSWVRLHRTAGTYREREYSMKYINRIVGNVPVMAFNDLHISIYQESRNAQKVSNKTINKEIYYILGMLRWCREEKGMAVRSVQMKKLPYSRPLPIVLSPGEVAKILKAASPFYRAFILCLYTLGLRFSEAQGLKWDDIDMANMAVRCRQKGGTFKILPMEKRLKAALKAIGPQTMGKYVFVSKITNRPIVNVRKALGSICAKAGISKHVYPHLFRHSVATAMMGDGTNLRTVQAMLGHADIGTTEFYTHVSLDHLRDAGKKIEAGMKKRRLSTG